MGANLSARCHPAHNLSVAYWRLGKYEKSLAEEVEALRLAPANGLIYCGLVIFNILLNHLDQAHTAAEEAQSKNLDSLFIQLVPLSDCLFAE